MDKFCSYCKKVIKRGHHSQKYHKICLIKYLSKYHREYYRKNKNKLKEYRKKYYQNNKNRWEERWEEYGRVEYEKNKDSPEFKRKREVIDKRYRKNHPENIRKYKIRNKEKIKNYGKIYRKKNSGYYEIYRKKNRKKIRENGKRYNQTEKGKITRKKRDLKRRALEKMVKDTLTKRELTLIQKRDKKCIYCGKENNLTFEHIIALNKGGENSFLNGVMACGGKKGCNNSKGDKDVSEWCESKGYKVPKIIIKNLKKMGEENAR